MTVPPSTTQPKPEERQPEFAQPVRILSDVHLGHPACAVETESQLAPLFEGAKTVIFNGDTAELRFSQERQKGLDHIEELKRICLASGANPVFVTGNHDPDISAADHLDILQGEMLVTHGDILYQDIAPWSLEADVLRKAHAEALAGIGPDGLTDLEKRLSATKRASTCPELREPHMGRGLWGKIVTHIETMWPPTRPFRIIRVWMETPHRAEMIAYAFRPRARFITIGHTHWAGVWTRSSRVIINTGGFTSVLGRQLIEIQNGTLSVHPITKRSRLFRCGIAKHHFELNASSGH